MELPEQFVRDLKRTAAMPSHLVCGIDDAYYAGIHDGRIAYAAQLLRALEFERIRQEKHQREMTPEEADVAYDESPADPLSSEEIERIINYIRSRPNA